MTHDQVCRNQGSFCHRFGLVGNRRLDEGHAGQNLAAGKVYQGRCPDDLGQIDVNRVGNLFRIRSHNNHFPWMQDQ